MALAFVCKFSKNFLNFLQSIIYIPAYSYFGHLIEHTYITRRNFPIRGKPTSEHRPPRCHSNAAFPRLWIWCLVSKIKYNVDWGLYQTLLPQIVLQSTKRIISQSYYEQDIATLCHWLQWTRVLTLKTVVHENSMFTFAATRRRCTNLVKPLGKIYLNLIN
jgi:hypothetical protein